MPSSIRCNANVNGAYICSLELLRVKHCFVFKLHDVDRYAFTNKTTYIETVDVLAVQLLMTDTIAQRKERFIGKNRERRNCGGK